MLKGKRILLGVCGGIAAYKSAILVRLLIKSGAEVKVIMTPSASDFIGKITLSTLSKNPVISDFISDSSTGEWNNHVDLGMWADLMVIAPGTANTISKMAHGACDNVLLAVYLSARCTVFVAPAMDLDMYAHPSTTENLQKLSAHGVKIIKPGTGELASGLTGTGRMAEPEDIFSNIENFFKKNLPLSGKKVLLTAGPTYESIDPVRFIGNHSSGTMGYSIADELVAQGAEVVLVSGPVSIKAPENNRINLIRVQSAQEMYESCLNHFDHCDISILAAAVADFTPEHVASQKIKKTGEGLTIQLKKTTDIAASLGKIKRDGQFIVGFALETENEEQNALKKLQSKNMDLIILNSLNDKGAGFGKITNKITIFDKDNNSKKFELKDKREVAKDIVSEIVLRINA
ncbi:MAG: bifunctional phosphopantothenoylcysteine decarboxylase/phosphopantothenate--cysteine ligase CoaBC [Cyclobacteriaceae bacterium]|nr:bifunctional phosphopantothenoylcysteine decarboxylase/phosphopantothenate--cysteine ligase CoaBC [Cyclobacteriaceae bacterium]